MCKRCVHEVFFLLLFDYIQLVLCFCSLDNLFSIYRAATSYIFSLTVIWSSPSDESRVSHYIGPCNPIKHPDFTFNLLSLVARAPLQRRLRSLLIYWSTSIIIRLMVILEPVDVGYRGLRVPPRGEFSLGFGFAIYYSYVLQFILKILNEILVVSIVICMILPFLYSFILFLFYFVRFFFSVWKKNSFKYYCIETN